MKKRTILLSSITMLIATYNNHTMTMMQESYTKIKTAQAPQPIQKPTTFQQSAVALKNTLAQTGIKNLGIIDSFTQITPESSPLTTQNVQTHTMATSSGPIQLRQPQSMSSQSSGSSISGGIAPYSQPNKVLPAKQLNIATPATTPTGSPASSRSSSPGFPVQNLSFNDFDLSFDIVQSPLSSRPSTPTSPISPSSLKALNLNKQSVADLTEIPLNDATQKITTQPKAVQQRNGLPTALTFTINASDALGRAGQALQAIPGQLYRAPGNLAIQLGHADGKIITGDANSVKSAYNSVATQVSSLPTVSEVMARTGKALQAIGKSAYNATVAVKNALSLSTGQPVKNNGAINQNQFGGDGIEDIPLYYKPTLSKNPEGVINRDRLQQGDSRVNDKFGNPNKDLPVMVKQTNATSSINMYDDYDSFDASNSNASNLSV